MRIFATTAIVTLIGAPAFAGGLNTPEPYVEPVVAPVAISTSNWTGGYVGAQLGYGNLNGDGVANNIDDDDDEDGDGVDDDDDDSVFDSDGDGALGGIYGGYLMQSGNLVYGGELSLNAADLEFDNGLGSIDQLHQLKLKVGYGLERTLVYGTVGAAYAAGDFNGNDVDDWGWEIGAGVDYLLTDSVSVGGEVTYNKFDDFDDTGVDFDATTISANVAYRF